MVQTRLQKWGNSLGVRIPLQLANQLNLHQRAIVSIDIEGERIVITLPKYNLDEMLEQITPSNQHHTLLEGDLEENEEC